jgi:hypothetical protein
VHSLAALQFILLRYGDGEPLPTDGFPGWSIRFEYDETTGTKRAFLFLDAPISNDANATRKFIRFVGEGDNGKVLFPLPKFVIVVSPFYGLCEIFEKMTAIYGVLIFQKPPYMVIKQNWRNYSL